MQGGAGALGELSESIPRPPPPPAPAKGRGPAANNTATPCPALHSHRRAWPLGGRWLV